MAALALLLALAIFYGGTRPFAENSSGKTAVRLACFPNLTHAPALVGVGRSEFAQTLGNNGQLQTTVFASGPEALEALLAGAIDMAYVGPGPAINTYLKSGGKALRLIASACEGGAGLVARPDAGIHVLRDLDGKRVATPQLGGTQDIALRHFLAQQGLRPREKGGTVQIVPSKPADTLGLFKRAQIDAAWLPEPWVSRLKQEAGAKLVFDERDLWPDRRFTATVLVVRTEFLKAHPVLVEAILQAHIKTVDWIRKNPVEAQQIVNGELKRLTGKPLAASVMKEAWERLTFRVEPHPSSIEACARMATEAGFLPPNPDLAGLWELNLLSKVRRAHQSADTPLARRDRNAS
jgi:NitT/TauT family transport system substrate-binding protein